MQHLISNNENSHTSKNRSENIFILEEQPKFSIIWIYLLSQTLIWVGIATIIFTLAIAL
ncbi:hypothetical protein [Flavobacterium sp.]|uniref:hypothetical protein n=1 Tax=Flavobacterium sp. TaxID=239 RepID=UPI00286A4437|nr:hypothetical protein [Flavobacterium sp.]